MNSTFENELDRIIEAWRSRPIENEWLFSQFRDDQVARMKPHEAFCAIGVTIERLLRIDDEGTIIEILQTILDLSDRSETTEIPIEFSAHKDQIEQKLSSHSDYAKKKASEIFRRYRISSPLLSLS